MNEDILNEILLEDHAFGPPADVVPRPFAVALEKTMLWDGIHDAAGL